jgi:hypothetical protein
MTGEAFEKFPWMDPEVTDNGHLETSPMTLPGVVASVAGLKHLRDGDKTITAYGQRHSQGGQSLRDHALAVDLDLLQDIAIQGDPRFAEPHVLVQAGATWDRLHRKLHQHGRVAGNVHWAPVTHQSSPHFSIGGSLAVNCHGRDPRQGPVSESVLALTVLKATGEPESLVRAPDGSPPPLMAMVLGGYGAGGLILDATLRLKHECILDLRYSEPMHYRDYCRRVYDFMTGPNPPSVLHHHAWLSCGAGQQLLTHAVSVESVKLADDVPDAHDRGKRLHPNYLDQLTDEGLLDDDMLSAIYHRYRQFSVAEIGAHWQDLVGQIRLASQGPMRQLNAMRSPVRFTQSHSYLVGKETWVDLMQEYFVPPNQLASFIEGARLVIEMAQSAGTMKLLTCTARALQEDKTTLLRYARGGPHCSVVFNFGAPLALAKGFRDESNALVVAVRALIDLAHRCQGSYYPCYGRFADPARFVCAFGQNQVQQLIDLRQQVDPGKKFSNHFLDCYF